jgi:hypothetical protein
MRPIIAERRVPLLAGQEFRVTAEVTRSGWLVARLAVEVRGPDHERETDTLEVPIQKLRDVAQALSLLAAEVG